MAARWSVDFSSVEKVGERIEQYGTGAPKVVGDYFNTKAYQKIETEIQRLIHPSGRTWKGKKPSATVAGIDSVFKHEVIDGGLTLRITSKTAYNYLYFPDDGSNTKRHVGDQQFTVRGAEAATPEVVDELLQRLTAAFEEG